MTNIYNMKLDIMRVRIVALWSTKVFCKDRRKRQSENKSLLLNVCKTYKHSACIIKYIERIYELYNV